MDQFSKNSSSNYEIISISSEHCQICWSFSTLSLEIQTSCGHSFCQSCFLSYYSSILDSFELYPFRCPVCESDIHRSLSKVLPKDEYKRYKKLRKRQILLKDSTVVWCPIINCEGYGRNDQGQEIKCNNCDYIIPNDKEPPLDETFQLSLVRCPVCQVWIVRTFACFSLRCYCGAEFCMKCRSNDLEGHQSWKCFASTNKDKTSFLLVFFCIFAYVLFPFFPAYFVFWYRKYCDRYYVKVINENTYTYAGLIVLASPIILVFSLFYLPFVWGFYCVDAMFNSKSRKYEGWWNVFKVVVYLPSVFFIFIGWSLLLTLLISFAPLFGLFLLGVELLDSLT